MYKTMLAAAALLSLAACDQYRTAGYGSSTYAGPPYAAPTYGTTAGSYGTNPAASAAQGCASGAPADMLHQNRPGGTDYNPARCRIQGY